MPAIWPVVDVEMTKDPKARVQEVSRDGHGSSAPL